MSILKKIFIISAILFVILLLLWGVYNLSFKKPAVVSPVNKTSDTPPVNNQKSTGLKIYAISDEAVLSPVLTNDAGVIKYYSQKTGQVYQTDFSGGNKTTIAQQELSGLKDVLWSPDKLKVITKFEIPGGKVRFYYYDYTESKGVPLKDNLDEVAWDNTSNKIFYKYYEPKTKARTFNVADPDGSNWKKLVDINYRNISIASIPKTGLVSFWNTADSYSETIFESISLIGAERKTIFRGKFGADFLWNNDGTKVLVSHTDAKGGAKMQLAVMNYNGGEYKNLETPTFVSKCAWSKDNQTIYCALPGGIPDNAVLPNEYNENKFTTTDTFWKINTLTGEKSRIAELADLEKLDGSIDAKELFLNSDESILFFVNKIDGKLYRMDL